MISGNSTPSKRAFDVEPVVVTPLRPMAAAAAATSLTELDELFEATLSLDDREVIDAHRAFIDEVVDDEVVDDAGESLDSKWENVLCQIQKEWGELFPETGGSSKWFAKLEAMFSPPSSSSSSSSADGGPVLFYLVPYLHCWATVHFGTTMTLFPRTVAAFTFAAWLRRTVPVTGNNPDHGFFVYQSLQSHKGVRLTTRFFNWFSKHLAGEKVEFDAWGSKIMVSPILLRYVSTFAEESVVSHLDTTGYNDFEMSEPLPLQQARFALNNMSGNRIGFRDVDDGTNSNGTTQLHRFAIESGRLFNNPPNAGSGNTVCQVSDELVDVMQSMVLKANMTSDPIERAMCHSVWGLSVMILVMDNRGRLPKTHPRCLRNEVSFYAYVVAKTTSRFIQYMLLAYSSKENAAGKRGAKKRLL